MFRKRKDRQSTPKEKRAARPTALSRWWDGMDESRRRTIARVYFFALGALVLVVGGAYVMRLLEHRALAGQSGPAPVKVAVALAEPPAWMPASLRQAICWSLLPDGTAPSDPRLAAKAFAMLKANPWVRAPGHVACRTSASGREIILEVKAEFRVPVACVLAQGAERVEFVDSEGVRLPSGQVPRYFTRTPEAENAPPRQELFLRRDEAPRGAPIYAIHYLTIEGVAAPAPAAGQKWLGEDLAAGLRLVAMLARRPYANQITTVDVRNFDGRLRRNEPYLSLRAQVADAPETIIRFGRLTDDGGLEVTTARKLYYLDTFVADQQGRLAGVAQYLDLRGDQLRFRPL